MLRSAAINSSKLSSELLTTRALPTFSLLPSVHDFLVGSHCSNFQFRAPFSLSCTFTRWRCLYQASLLIQCICADFHCFLCVLRNSMLCMALHAFYTAHLPQCSHSQKPNNPIHNKHTFVHILSHAILCCSFYANARST